jgi:Spy/CpxP family protein refolding chaperone
MKHITTLLSAVTLCGLSFTASAQTPAASATPAPSAERSGPGDPKNHADRMLAGLPDDIRERFKAARDAAESDPKIKELRQKADAAMREFHTAMREAVSKADPELAEKVRLHAENWKGSKKGKDQKGNGPRDGGPMTKNLPPEQRDRLEAAIAIAKQAPAVQSAETAMKSAQNREDRQAARENFHKAMREAILTADPTLADVLEKNRPPRRCDLDAPAPEDQP